MIWIIRSFVCVWMSALSCPTLCNPTGYSSPGSSVHGILRARILEWVAMPSSREPPWPRDRGIEPTTGIANKSQTLSTKPRSNLRIFLYQGNHGQLIRVGIQPEICSLQALSQPSHNAQEKNWSSKRSRVCPRLPGGSRWEPGLDPGLLTLSPEFPPGLDFPKAIQKEFGAQGNRRKF